MDFYLLLGLGREASLSEIKRAYRRLARKYHPDINPGDRTAVTQFRQIAEAYETLSDPGRRHQYDTAGGTPGVASSTFGFDGFDFSVSVSGASAPTFGDLFAEVLHQREQRRDGRAPERGADLHQSIAIGFEESILGSQRPVSVTRQVHCRGCRGTGRLPAAESRCAHCQATGTVKSARGHIVFSKPCPYCRGTGRQADVRCSLCAGQQVEIRADTLTIQLPPGLADGDRIRVAGHGHAGRDGGEPGDLYVTVHVQPHPIFHRDGDDLHVTVPIAIDEAALGARVDVPSLEGTARLRVPPGTQSGQRFRLRERGVQSSTEGRRGDLVVEVRLTLPRVLDERSKELLREFGRLNAADEVRRELKDVRSRDVPVDVRWGVRE